jgi:gamma-glutamylcyclotransferase (GGCT)/AIG2-like uncharacterized protein YtfP
MTRVFVYGTLLFQTRVHVAPRSVVLCEAMLQDWERISRDGLPTIVPHEGSSVMGQVIEVTDRDLAALDMYEGVASGLYSRRSVVVETESGEMSALVYVMNRQMIGEVR